MFSTTTPIRYQNRKGGGTGFFLNYNDETYLVTNRHVIDPDDASPSQARIWFRDFGNLTETNHYDISLSLGDGSDWFGHPESEEVDLAVIPLNMQLSTIDEVRDEDHNTGSLAFTRQHYIHDNITVDNKVRILGYPGDFVDRTSLFPVQRNALIASPYGYPFDGDPYFVTDARMHPGTSGSPVLFDTGGMLHTTGDVPKDRLKDMYLLGVHSATFYDVSSSDIGQNDQHWETTQKRSEGNPTKYELNVAWYPKLIDDILTRI